jgi:hypothetical protein
MPKNILNQKESFYHLLTGWVPVSVIEDTVVGQHTNEDVKKGSENTGN